MAATDTACTLRRVRLLVGQRLFQRQPLLPQLHRPLVVTLDGRLLFLLTDLPSASDLLRDLRIARRGPQPHFRSGLVHHVNRLVGEVAFADVAVGQLHGHRQGLIGDTELMVLLVLRAQALQNLDRRLLVGRSDVYRLEAPFERRVLLDMLAVLVRRGGANRAQLPAGQRRLEQVPGVNGAIARTGADQGMHLVNEENDRALGVLHLLDDAFDALLELAAELGAGQQRPDVERQHSLAEQRLRDGLGSNALRQPLGDSGLPDTGRTDQDGVVLGAAAEDLHQARDFLVTADHRVELVVLGQLSQVNGVLREHPGLVFGRGAIHRARATHVLQRLGDAVGGQTGWSDQPRPGPTLGQGPTPGGARRRRTHRRVDRRRPGQHP